MQKQVVKCRPNYGFAQVCIEAMEIGKTLSVVCVTGESNQVRVPEINKIVYQISPNLTEGELGLLIEMIRPALRLIFGNSECINGRRVMNDLAQKTSQKVERICLTTETNLRIVCRLPQCVFCRDLLGVRGEISEA